MVQQTAVRAYRMKPMTPEMRDKVNLSYAESLDLRERELKCPNCKAVTTYNLGYFRRRRCRRAAKKN